MEVMVKFCEGELGWTLDCIADMDIPVLMVL